MDMEEIVEEEPAIPKYQSRSGFVTAAVHRGFTEIAELYRTIGTTVGHDRAFLCGGYVRWMCSPGQKPNPAGDADVYCRDMEAFEALKAEFKAHLAVRHENDIAVTYRKATDGRFAYCPQIQLIKPEDKGAIVASGSMENILAAFDFTVIRGGLTSPETALVDADFDHDEAQGFLRIKNIHCPISSVLRFMKYSQKGYHTSPSQVVLLFADWMERDQEYRIEILEKLREIESGAELTEEQINHLEALMRID